MKASSESGEWATVIVRVSAIVDMLNSSVLIGTLDQADIAAVDWVIDCISLDGFKTRFLNQAHKLAARHLDFIIGFDRITFGKFTAVSDGSINVIGAEMQSNLRQTFSQHYPVCLQVIEIIEQQTRHSHRLQ